MVSYNKIPHKTHHKVGFDRIYRTFFQNPCSDILDTQNQIGYSHFHSLRLPARDDSFSVRTFRALSFCH